MILSTDEIKSLGPRETIPGVDDYTSILKISHLEANARIRELEAQAQDWHERYVICCEDSRLEKEALRNELIEANAKLRELVEAAEWRDGVINFYATPQIAFTKSGWWDRLDYENCRKADAEAAYQAALKAVKEEPLTNFPDGEPFFQDSML